MTEFKVMGKRGKDRRFSCFLHTSESSRADRFAEQMANNTIYKNVKVVATDDNGIVNELIYK